MNASAVVLAGFLSMFSLKPIQHLLDTHIKVVGLPPKSPLATPIEQLYITGDHSYVCANRPPEGGYGCRRIVVTCVQDLPISPTERDTGLTVRKAVAISLLSYGYSQWSDTPVRFTLEQHTEGWSAVDAGPNSMHCGEAEGERDAR